MTLKNKTEMTYEEFKKEFENYYQEMANRLNESSYNGKKLKTVNSEDLLKADFDKLQKVKNFKPNLN